MSINLKAIFKVSQQEIHNNQWEKLELFEEKHMSKAFQRVWRVVKV